MIKRSSLCGRNEYKNTKKNVENRSPARFLSLENIPNGTNGRTKRRHLGMAEEKYHKNGEVCVTSQENM